MYAFVKTMFSLIRIKHWIKNLIVFAPLLFAWKLTDMHACLIAALAFITFCLISSAVYIFNDIHDIKTDKKHPKKSLRPIPSGKISIRFAIITSIILIISSLGLGWLINPVFLCCIASYLALNLFYTYKGKNIVIFDAFCIAIGFVLRVIGGAFAIAVNPSGWIIMTTFFLCLFLGFGKRRNELLSLKEDSASHRSVLKLYSHSLLDHFILSSGTIATISYALYTLSPTVNEHFHTGDKLIFTIPFVAYVIFRYMYLIWSREDGDPTDVILKDASLLIAGVLWLIATVGIISISILKV